ncbi:MAG: helix-turn-helix domain-containing protein [Lentisphaerae bacterium]|nr:helix-turn-helix domain-containing protein [Lentisphaerota bacterium]
MSTYAGKGYFVAAMKSIHIRPVQDEGKNVTKIHSHDYYELVIVVRGEGIHWIQGKRYDLAPGQVYLLRPGDTHYYEDFQHLTLQNFMFSRGVLRTCGKLLRALSGYETFFQNDEIQPKIKINSSLIAESDVILQYIGQENQRKSYQNSLLQFSYIAMLLGKLLDEEATGVTVLFPKDNLQNAIAYMRQNYSKRICVKVLADICNMSYSSFHVKFRQEFAASPMQWLMNFRLQKAMQMLMRSEKSIAEVAYACGFVDPLYFSRQFRKNIGCSPRKYRLDGQGNIERLQGERTQKDSSYLKLHSYRDKMKSPVELIDF